MCAIVTVGRDISASDLGDLGQRVISPQRQRDRKKGQADKERRNPDQGELDERLAASPVPYLRGVFHGC